MFVVIFKQALQSIFANKIRSLLTTLGIIIGISSVIIMITAGDGVKKIILDQIEGLGSNLVRIAPGVRSEFGPAIGSPPTLKIKDYEDLKKNIAGIRYIVPQFFAQKETSYKKESRVFSIYGTSPDMFKILKATFEQGRPFTESEVTNVAKMAVIGPNVKQELFGDENPMGKRIKIENNALTIIGVTKAQGGILGALLDSAITIPVSTSKIIFGNRDWLNAIIIEPNTKEDIPAITQEIETIIRKNHKLTPDDSDDFYVRTQADSLKIIDTIFNIITLFITAVAGISLIVGGIGIMNIMYVTVTERTREIGLRKALGAKKQTILWQFLFEAIILTIAGALVGLLVSFSLALLVNLIFQLQIKISVFSIVLAISVSSFFGLTFGYLPAHQAAEKDPIEALRYE